MTELVGVIVGNYFLLECMAHEGLIETYRARPIDRGGCDVILRLFRPLFPNTAAFRDHFALEVEKVWRCQHPHILPLLEFGTGEELLYCVTAFPDTPSLEQLLHNSSDTTLPLTGIAHIMLQLCTTVQYIHEQHIVHGNIQPSSIYLNEDDTVWLAHFGMKRAYHPGEPLVVQIDEGNPYYTAPEQGLGMVCSASDIYALGILCYRLLTGTLPFQGETVEEVIVKHSGEDLPSLRSLRPDLPEAVEMVLHMALAKLPEQRFPTAGLFARALHAALTNEHDTALTALVPKQRITVQARRTGHNWPYTVPLFSATQSA